ncbi:CHASE domain-containing protein [bacterium]|nr:CHASE domain-containing protein [bacterium]
MSRQRGFGQEGRFRTWRPAILVFVVIAALTVIGTALTQQFMGRGLEARLALQTESLAASLDHGAQDVESRLVNLAALFTAREEVTAEEFEQYVTASGLADGVGGMAYMPIVHATDLGAFEEQMAAAVPGYQVFEIDAEGNRVPVGPRDWYFPVQYFEPPGGLERPLGLDAGSPPGRLPYLMEAVTSGRAVTTPIVPLATTRQHGFIAYIPVTDSSGTVTGVVASPVVFEDLATVQIPEGLARVLDWTIRDVTEEARRLGVTAFPDIHVQILPPTQGGMVHSDTIHILDRIMQVDAVPSADSSLPRDRFLAHWILLAGLVIALMAGVIAHLLSRRAETLRKVAKLSEVLGAKQQFVATVSHELRTPLTSVMGFADILRDQTTELSADDRAEFIDAIADEALDLSSMIDDLLTMTRANQGTLTVVAQPTDLRAQASQVLEGLNQTRIPMTTTPKAGCVLADPARVRQIVRNLVTNASAHGGPDIRVRIAPAGDRIGLEVIDDGSGVPPGDEERIFDQYFSAGTVQGRTSSMGIGLSVSRTLAQLMGGDLSYRRVGGKTIFQLSLPAARSLSDTNPAVETPAQAEIHQLSPSAST